MPGSARWATLALALVVPLAPSSADGGSPLAPIPPERWTVEAAGHLLRRAGFGGSREEVRALHARGLDGAVDHLLGYATVPDPGPAEPQITMRGQPRREMFVGLTREQQEEVRGEFIRADVEQMQRVREWWLRRMIATPRPLEERMTLLWHGLFTSAHRTVRNSYHLWLQNSLFRRHATGSFRRLLKEVSRDPAMLRYLDGDRNRKGRPNENYAREVMELFTMGVGNYAEKDVQEAARAFTGWTSRGNEFFDDRRNHDDGPKTFLGKTGRLGGDDVLDAILEHPATARHVASLLFRGFAHDRPPPDVVEGLAALLRASDYEVAPVLGVLLRSEAFYAPESVATSIKGPVDFVVSLLRSLDASPPPRPPLPATTQVLGQELFDPPNVKGWPGGEAWITTSTLLQRYNFAAAVVGAAPPRPLASDAPPSPGMGAMGGMGGPEALATSREAARPFDALADARARGLSTAEAAVDHYAALLLAVPVPVEMRERLVRVLVEDGPFDLASPRASERLRRMLQLLVSTPEFQLR
jgi:hypothetical protein